MARNESVQTFVSSAVTTFCLNYIVCILPRDAHFESIHFHHLSSALSSANVSVSSLSLPLSVCQTLAVYVKLSMSALVVFIVACTLWFCLPDRIDIPCTEPCHPLLTEECVNFYLVSRVRELSPFVETELLQIDKANRYTASCTLKLCFCFCKKNASLSNYFLHFLL